MYQILATRQNINQNVIAESTNKLSGALYTCTHHFGKRRDKAATERTSVVRIWLQKANRLECHVVGNSELAAILEIPEAVREGHQGCDGQSVNE